MLTPEPTETRHVTIEAATHLSELPTRVATYPLTNPGYFAAGEYLASINTASGYATLTRAPEPPA